MKKQNSRERRGLVTLAAAFALTFFGHPATSGRAAAATTAAECEGNACAAVAVTFDEARQQYRAQNNSTDRWVRVTAANLAASTTACLAPGKEGLLPLKSLAGTYKADFAQERCGQPVDDGE